MLKLLGSALILGAGAWLRWNTLAQQRRQRRGEPLAPVWRTLSGELPLPLQSREVLADLGADLHGDEEAVCKAISLAVQRLEQHREDLENSRQAEEKRVTALCFSGAALLVILLI